MLPRLLALVGALGELGEAEVAVGDEGAHAEFPGQGEGLAVVFSSLLSLRRLAPSRNVVLSELIIDYSAKLHIEKANADAITLVVELPLEGLAH